MNLTFLRNAKVLIGSSGRVREVDANVTFGGKSIVTPAMRAEYERRQREEHELEVQRYKALQARRNDQA